MLLGWYGISSSSYYRWLGCKTASNSFVTRRNPRSLLPEEVETILQLRQRYPEQGYKSFSYILMNHGIFVSETAIYRVLKHYQLLGYWNNMAKDPASKEYRNKPTIVHQHWHTDIAYVKVGEQTYYLIILLDGYSRFLLHWKLLTDMTTNSVSEFIIEAKDKYSHENPKLISDNGTCFISRDFKKLVSNINIQQVFTRRNHPQTNGKAERMVKSIRDESLRPYAPQSFTQVCSVIENYQYVYNYQRLHAAINYLTPADLFFGRKDEILASRKHGLLAARQLRVQLNKLRFSSLS